MNLIIYIVLLLYLTSFISNNQINGNFLKAFGKSAAVSRIKSSNPWVPNCGKGAGKGKFIRQKCLNNNCVEEFASEAQMCILLVEVLNKPYENEQDFRHACNAYLGHWCLWECRALARLFDRQTYTSILGNRGPQHMFPNAFGNNEQKYRLLLDDCEVCIREYRCFVRPPRDGVVDSGMQ